MPAHWWLSETNVAVPEDKIEQSLRISYSSRPNVTIIVIDIDRKLKLAKITYDGALDNRVFETCTFKKIILVDGATHL